MPPPAGRRRGPAAHRGARGEAGGARVLPERRAALGPRRARPEDRGRAADAGRGAPRSFSPAAPPAGSSPSSARCSSRATRCSARPRTSSSTARTPGTSAASSGRSPARPPAFELDVAALEAAIGPRTRVVIVNTPNNPAGSIYDAATLRALGEALARKNAGRERPIFLVSDEPYRALAYDGATVPPVLPGLALRRGGRLVLEDASPSPASGWGTSRRTPPCRTSGPRWTRSP